MRRAVFLDRDGTINIDKNYLFRAEDWEWTPRAVEAIGGFNDLGFLVIVVTNQAGIARGYYDHEDVQHLHRYINKILAEFNACIDAYYYCPHHPDFGQLRICNCRKPKTGLLEQAIRDFEINVKDSFMIGDKISDIQAGVAVGATPILVGPAIDNTAKSVANLYEAYQWIKQRTFY